MIITKKTPFTKEEIKQLAEEYEDYIKTVIDLEKKICSAGGVMHADNEKELVDQGYKRENIWGGGVDLINNKIRYSSLINIRGEVNESDEILSPEIRKKFEELTRYFFANLWT